MFYPYELPAEVDAIKRNMEDFRRRNPAPDMKELERQFYLKRAHPRDHMYPPLPLPDAIKKAYANFDNQQSMQSPPLLPPPPPPAVDTMEHPLRPKGVRNGKVEKKNGVPERKKPALLEKVWEPSSEDTVWPHEVV
ncbi:MAG: hypothetical protein GY696_34770 [Gammaproteobacteria bacterium]|nr:hypothetical protein [Gammaproteobacteria bacterium]